MTSPVTDESRIDRLAAAAAGGDREARARCVELAFPHLRAMARRYEGHGVACDDLQQEVALGLLRALEGYDASRGTPFLAWARIWVRQALQQSLAEHSRPFRLTRHALWDLHELKSTQERLWQHERSEPTLSQLAHALAWPEERVTNVLSERPDQRAPRRARPRHRSPRPSSLRRRDLARHRQSGATAPASACPNANARSSPAAQTTNRSVPSRAPSASPTNASQPSSNARSASSAPLRFQPAPSHPRHEEVDVEHPSRGTRSRRAVETAEARRIAVFNHCPRGAPFVRLPESDLVGNGISCYSASV